ncbi:phage regulatory CII family protein [Variovorax boronicumulans]|uniref:phage regulatory CII family protein n=1 Tax=Variovorax boronicumulans TaxID=436515 RepID=UPI0012E5D975|nr:phage regulatory CII family protein [Variovorax boronicumulans]GER21287.1 hypothetical protein VCH24_63340 [Variovorax boronicumulans]
MNTADALKLMVKTFPGGVDTVAGRIGKNSETLRKELSGADPKFKLGEGTAQLISDLCVESKSPNCMAYVNAVNASSGGFVRLPVLEAPPAVNLHKGLAEIVQEMSHVVTAVTESDADDVISDNDLQRSLREMEEARSAIQALEQAVRSKHAAGKRNHVRAVA